MMISGSRSGHLQLRTSTTTTHASNNGTFHDQQVPPSPTLTNPDMILPFDHDERESSTPSPPFNLPTLEQLQSLHRRQASGDSLVDGSQIGVAISSQDRPDTRPFPRPRWPFEGHEATSRRLSAIGEEDSASPEQVKRRTSGLAQHATHAKRGLTGSPAFRRAADEQHRHMDGETVRSASSSSSTVSANGSGSGSGSASSHGGTRQSEDWESPNDNSTGEHLRNSIMSVSEKDGPKEDPSSAILSTEAERILENAKKRLSLMEGNLNRARSSMRLSPSLSSSPSPVSANAAAGFNQPVGGLYRSISRSDRKPSLLRPRQPSNTAQDGNSNGNGNRHSRVYSEINLSLAAQTDHPAQDPDHLPRSVSAMASTSMSNHYGGEHRSFRYDSTRAYLTHRASTSSIRSPTLGERRSPSLHEEASSGLGISNGPEPPRVSSIEDFNAAHPPSKPPSRAQSQMQVRDLKDQMKGLHIKISTLKVKSQEDSLRRRSLQSLRTSSPFAAAEQWYTSAVEYRDTRGSLSADAGHGWSASEHARSSPRSSDQDQRSSNPSKQSTPRGSPPPPRSIPISPPTDTFTEFDDSTSVVESLYEDAESGHPLATTGEEEDLSDEEFSDSLNAFPSVPQQTLNDTPHEEREDAFDYEHFILHSALGNFSQAKLRRSSSVGSTSSVETTRPVYSVHSRANSTTSLSTEATFATATEGEYPSDEEGDEDDEVQSVLYWDKMFNRELRSRQRYRSPVQTHYEGQPSGVQMTTTTTTTDEDVPDTPHAIQETSGSDHRTQQHSSSSSTTHSRTSSQTLQLHGPSSPSPATPRALASSLVSSVRAASASASASASTVPRNTNTTNSSTSTNGTSGINHDDTRLLEELFQSLGNVCMELQTITTTPDHDPKAARLLRRRLDAARRVLEGELDA